MSKNEQPVNSTSTFAAVRNVALCASVMDQLMNRAPNMPGLGVFSGPSGYGKSIAAAYCANEYEAVYVECRSYFTKKSLLLAILNEMGTRPGKTVYEMVEQIGEQLALSGKGMVIDETDHIVDRNLVELLRDIYEVSGAPILMIGEERFPQKLKRWERFHNRVLRWELAQPTDLGDAKKFAKLYSPDVAIGDDLLKKIVEATRGCARRICVNIENVRLDGATRGAKTVDLSAWGNKTLYTGEAPLRRAA
jgi:DNA transposition AAA+ family ATPase